MVVWSALFKLKASMSHLSNFMRAATAGALILAAAPSHSAAPPALQGSSGYHQSCMRSVDFPRPFGEWDLKGNPKLKEYCDCYVPLFTVQSNEARAAVDAHGGPPTAEMKKANKASELALRNSCRKQVGLPAVYNPKDNAPGGKGSRVPRKKLKTELDKKGRNLRWNK